MPYWAIFVVVAVLGVGYYLLNQSAKERRRERAAGDFAKIPSFYANQSYTDVKGEVAIGIDDRGRRIAVSRKRAQPRTRVYSFAHIVSAEVVQNGSAIFTISRVGRSGAAGAQPGEPAGDGLFGSTNRPSLTRLPAVRPLLGPLTTVGVRVVFQNGSRDDVLVRFYDGKAVNVDGVVGERAFAEAQVFLGSVDIAMKRAGMPPRGAATLKTPVL
jgi:hypothetical protein